MMHVSGFLYLGQDGRWRARWIDFEAAPELEITAEEVKAMSSRHLPNLKDSANVIKLLFGGNGDKDTEYQRAAIMYDWDSIASQKQLTVKMLKSEILPTDRLDVAGTIVNRILAMTRQGIQTISIVAPLRNRSSVPIYPGSCAAGPDRDRAVFPEAVGCRGVGTGQGPA